MTAALCGAIALPGAAFAQVQAQVLERAGARPAVLRPEPTSSFAPAEGKSIAQLIEDLGADDYETRERATLALAAVDFTPEEIVRQIPPDVEWTPERRSRMESALWARFEDSPRAGLGTGFARDLNVSGVTLALVMPDFPASEFLRTQDVIIEVDGCATTGPDGQNVVRAAILSRDPGESLPMTVLREGRRLALRVPLGRYDDLANPSQLDPLTLESAWLMRRARLGLFNGATESAEAAVVRVNCPGPWPQQLVMRRTPGAINLLAGGISSSGDDLDRMRRKTVASSQQVLARNQDNLMQQRDRFLRMIAEHRDEAEKHRLRLKDPNLPEALRIEAQRQMEAADQQADRLTELLRQIMEQNGLP